METKEREGAIKQNIKNDRIKINYILKKTVRQNHLLKEKTQKINKQISIYMLSIRKRAKIKEVKNVANE